VRDHGSVAQPEHHRRTQAAERHKTPVDRRVASATFILERRFKYVTRVNVKASWYGEAQWSSSTTQRPRSK